MERIYFRNPWIRTLIPLLLMGVISVLGNSLVVEISDGNKVLWSHIPKTGSFYLLLIATLLLGIYQFLLFKHDTNLLKGFTAKQYEAAIRNKVAEVVAKRSIKLIHDGEIEQLEKETDIFRKLYGGG